ncbi:MAG: EF-P lysine aminoacylase EpmA [Polyangiales bacterium]
MKNDRALIGAVVFVQGRLLKRDGLLVLRDADHEVQLVCSADLPSEGSIVRARGLWDGAAFQVEAVELLTVALKNERPDHEALQERTKNLRLRHQASRAVRRYFDEADFVEVETPLIVPSPGLDLHLDAFEVPYGDELRYLITSPEYQMKRVLAGGLTRIYQLARCFRKGEIGARHEPEFTLIEWYRAFAGSADVMADTEQLVAFVAQATLETTVLPCGVDVAPPWPRRRVADVFEEYAKVTVESVLPDEERFFRLYVDEVEPQLGNDPFFLTHWPASMASLARLLPEEPDVADRFEAYIGGLEISNGFGELVDADEQRRRLMRDRKERSAAGLPAYPIDERFVGALEEGIPPSGGNALGFDRLVMLLSGASHIEDVLALPHRRL